MDNKIEQLKRQYNEIPIPAELDSIVHKALHVDRKPAAKRFKSRWLIGVAASAAVFVAGINASPAFAQSLTSVPVLGNLVKVLTFTEYKIDEGNYQAKIEVPALSELGDPSLEASLNSKYLAEGRELYEQFMDEMRKQQALGEDGHIGIDSGYIVKTDTDQILSVGRYVVETMGSSAETVQYDTIDKKNRVLVTLPSLFQDDRYIEAISANIIDQMKRQMKDDPSKTYWVEPSDMPEDAFTAISETQNFYINSDHKLVIVFNEYDVAPGYMGTVEFVIPTEVLQPILVSNEYVR